MTDDLISRQAAIRWVKTECNPYGKPTLDFESGKKVIEHLEQMPAAEPDIARAIATIIENEQDMRVIERNAEPRWIPVTERVPEIDMSYPHHKNYLVQYDSGAMDVASWSNVNRFWTNHVTKPYWNCVQFAEVVAWMPLPTPWKGESDE